MKRSLTAILLSIFVSLSIEAAVKTSSLRSNLKKHQGELSSISREIFSIEKNLGKGNKRYLSTLKKRRKFEDKIAELTARTRAEQKITHNKKVVTERRLKQAMVQNLGGQNTPAQLLSYKIVTRMLKGELTELNDIHQSHENLIKELEFSKRKYSELRNMEDDLLSLMNEMEEAKQLKSQRYVKVKKIKEELQGKLKLKKAKKYVKKKKSRKASIKERFKRPIKQIIDLEYGKKGVTFKFKERQPVLASRAGKVIHTGSLSTYGNVVMVDHGNDVRSIFLGQFLPSVKKGQSVRPGESLGDTFDVAKNEGKLYFEVRKKNKAQNTILLIDNNTALKKSSRRI